MEPRFLFAVDGSEHCNSALASMARFLGAVPGAQLLLVHCVRKFSGMPASSSGEAAPPLGLPDKVAKDVFYRSKKILTENGFPASRMETEPCFDSTDPAMDILNTARREGIETVIVARRGMNPAKTLLLGGVSERVTTYSEETHVWVIDTPVKENSRVLLAVSDPDDCRLMAGYAATALAPIEGLRYTFFNVKPVMPAGLWDDGHILSAGERADREATLKKWAAESKEAVVAAMESGREKLRGQGVAGERIDVVSAPLQRGIARDLLAEIQRNDYQFIVMGKKSLSKKSPFLMGSHAGKILGSFRGAALCMVGARVLSYADLPKTGTAAG